MGECVAVAVLQTVGNRVVGVADVLVGVGGGLKAGGGTERDGVRAGSDGGLEILVNCCAIGRRYREER